jgi:hypothetical protein
MFNAAEQAKDVLVATLATDAAGRTSTYVSLKDYEGFEAMVYITQGNAATILCSLLQATAVAGTGSKAGPTVQVYSNLDVATSDALVRRTDGSTYTTDAAVKNKIVKFVGQTASLDTSNGFDCIAVSTGASNVANITAIVIRGINPRYSQVTPPTALTD